MYFSYPRQRVSNLSIVLNHNTFSDPPKLHRSIVILSNWQFTPSVSSSSRKKKQETKDVLLQFKTIKKCKKEKGKRLILPWSGHAFYCSIFHVALSMGLHQQLRWALYTQEPTHQLHQHKHVQKGSVCYHDKIRRKRKLKQVNNIFNLSRQLMNVPFFEESGDN